VPRETKARKVGTVTVLFTDLVGSTETLDRVGDDVADHIRRRHFRMLRQVVRDWGGHEVKSLGDGLMIVFSSAYDAAACAIAIQTRSAQDPDRPQVRVGLHSGEVAWEEDDVFGTPVVIARRLCDSAGGGQILASDLVRNLIGTRGGFSFRDVGFMELKGLSTALAASEIVLPEDADKFERSGPKPKSQPRFSLRRALWIAAAALTAGAIAFVVLPLDDSGEGLSPDDGRAPDRANTNSGPSSLSWIRQHPGRSFVGPGEQVMLDVITRGSSPIVAGRDGRGGDPEAVVWRPSKAGRWTQIPLDSPSDTDEEQVVNALVAQGRRLVAVGFQGLPGEYDGVAWTSRDGGSSWERVHDPEPNTPGLQVMNDVVNGGNSLLIAVGYEAIVPGESDGAVWTSRRGRSWTRVPDPSAQFGGPGQQEIREIIRIDNGFLAVGRSETEVGDSDPAVWFSSPSGQTWERLGQESLGQIGYQTMTTVVAGGPGYIAAGFDTVLGHADAAIWTSSDLRNWERVDRSDSVFGGEGSQKINVLTRVGKRFVAAGFDESLGDGDAAVWVSTDGERWTREPGSAIPGGEFRQQIDGLVAIGGRMLAVGQEARTDDIDAAIWTARLRQP
jgi:class 3 adenylate cyclase